MFEGTTGYYPGASALYFRIDGALQTSSLDGGPLTEFVSAADLGGTAINYADDDEHLYWVINNAVGDNSVRRVPIDGGAVEILASFPNSQDPRMLALDDTHAWWLITTGEELGIWRATK